MSGFFGKSVTTHHFKIRERVVLKELPKNFTNLELWCPVVPSTPCQQVLSIEVQSPWPYELNHEPEHGNLILHVATHSAPSQEASLEISYRIERFYSEPERLDGGRVIETRPQAHLQRYLKSERFLPHSERTVALARKIAGEESNPLDRVRRVYSYVLECMRQRTLERIDRLGGQRVPDGQDALWLFICLLRSLGIPARPVSGHIVETAPEDGEICSVAGPHAWAEFYLDGLGWVPVDVKCALKYGKQYLFGHLEAHHVAWCVGSEVQFTPPQKGARVPFVLTPYVEIDGAPHVGVHSRLSYVELPVGRPSSREY